MARPPENACRWVDRATALATFATFEGPTQGQAHIKPLHWYVACRLVLEGGFRPEEIMPRPPFTSRKADGWELTYDPSVAGTGERTILGGLKTKDVDVVVTKEGLGPVLAVSCKGAIGAFRNLTNRMEEAVGDCTNLHITYPALVTGYFMVMRAHRRDAKVAALATEPDPTLPSRVRPIGQNDIAIEEGGAPVEAVVRFHNALRELTARRGIRDDVSRYEAVAMALVDPSGPKAGDVLDSYPTASSSLRVERFFETLYLRYDERYVYSAPDLKAVTHRREWVGPPAPVEGVSLPVHLDVLDYQVRTA